MQKATKWAAQEAVTRILGAQAKAPPQAHGQEEGNISSTQCLQEHHATPGRQPEWKSVKGTARSTGSRRVTKIAKSLKGGKMAMMRHDWKNHQRRLSRRRTSNSEARRRQGERHQQEWEWSRVPWREETPPRLCKKKLFGIAFRNSLLTNELKEMISMIRLINYAFLHSTKAFATGNWQKKVGENSCSRYLMSFKA